MQESKLGRGVNRPACGLTVGVALQEIAEHKLAAVVLLLRHGQDLPGQIANHAGPTETRLLALTELGEVADHERKCGL